MTNVNLTKDRTELMNAFSEILFKVFDGQTVTSEEMVDFGNIFEKFQIGSVFDQFKEQIREDGVNMTSRYGYVDVTKGTKVVLDWEQFQKEQPEAGRTVVKAWMADVQKEGPSFAKLRSYLSADFMKEHGIRSKLDPARDSYAKEVEATAKVEFHPF